MSKKVEYPLHKQITKDSHQCRYKCSCPTAQCGEYFGSILKLFGAVLHTSTPPPKRAFQCQTAESRSVTCTSNTISHTCGIRMVPPTAATGTSTGISIGNEPVAATSQALFRWISAQKGTHFRPFLYPVSFVFYAVYRIVYAHPVFIVQLEAGVRAPHSRRLSFFLNT